MSKIRDKIKLEKTLSFSATFLVAFLLSYYVSGTASPISNSSALTCDNGMVSNTDDVCSTDSTDVNVSIEGAWTVAVSSSGTLSVDITPSSSGTTSTATDDVNVYTNTPNGYQLYLNSTSGSTDIYNNNILDESGNLDSNLPSGTNTNHFSATSGTKASPASLTSNTWGYSLVSNPSIFSKVETSSSETDSLITSGTKTTGSGDDIDVTYGFRADTKLTPGTYTTSVTYTAVAEVPSYSITGVSPNELHINDQTSKTITIMTSTPVTELGLGDITAKITNAANTAEETSTNTVTLTNCTEIVQEVSGINYRGAQCTYTGSLPVGTYNVQLTSSWHSATYTLTGGFKIYKTVNDITTMQEMTTDICSRMSDNQTATLQDPRGSYNTTTPANYGIVKALDGNCWMTDNFNLYNRQISDVDSDLPANTTITLPNTSNWSTNVYTDMRVHRATNSGYTDVVYYNYCSAVGLTTTCNTTIQQDRSICPKNWQLPIYNSEAVDKTMSKLFNEYGITSGANVLDSSNQSYVLGFHKYYGEWDYYNAREAFQSTTTPGGARFWTSTPYSNSGDAAWYYAYYDSVRYFANLKSYGFNIRCVAR